VRVERLEVRDKARAAEISVALFFVLLDRILWHVNAILVAYPFGHVGRYEFTTPVDGDVEVLLDIGYHVLEPATEGAITHSRCTS
jgi:hypothetical protein